MRLSLPSRPLLHASGVLIAICGVLSCTPQQVIVEHPCPPVETTAVKAPAVVTPTSDAAVPRTLDIRLTPTRNEGANVVAVDVVMRFSVPPVDFGSAEPIAFHLDPHIAGAAIGDRIEDLAARDSEGSLGFRRMMAGDPGKPVRAEWKAERRARGPVTVSYRVQLLAEDAARDEVISSAGGMLGVGRALFLIPTTTESHAVRVNWDLQALGPGAHGSSSFGGDGSTLEGPPSMLESAIWVAGPLEEMALRTAGANGDPGSRFRMISLGKTAFDITEVGPWAHRVWLSVRPIAAEATSFELFVHSSGKPGTRLDIAVFGHSVMATMQNDVKLAWPERLRLTEGFSRAARGTNVMSQRWFDDGFDTYVALDALRRVGPANAGDIAAEITKRAERYFSSLWLRTPMADVLGASSDAAAKHVEDRGLFYAAELDAKIRSASAGKRSLVDFIRTLAPAPANNDATDASNVTGINVATFLNAIEKEMGADGVARYRAVVESGSAQANVPDDAFGPCFKKAKKKIQREDSGSKKRESVDGFSLSVVPKLPPSCAHSAPAQVGGLQKTL